METIRLDTPGGPEWTPASTQLAALTATKTNYYRSIWISDLHLGTPRCKAELLYDFLRHHEAETLYLVGDFVDGWIPDHSWYQSPA